MANNCRQDPGTARGSETTAPAGMMKMMERAGCGCAPMMARCEGSDQDTKTAEPAEAAQTGPEKK